MPNFASLLIGNKIFKDFSMDWINDLLWGEGIGHSILLLSFVIAAGIQLGKIKVFGISLGITLVLFVGIILGHLGFTVNHNVIHFFKEFGLILFVYSVGMQVGPGFFSSFRQGGITLNMLACGIVFLGVATALVLHFVTGIPMPTMVGILSGAVTNTPGLGAAQQAYSDMYGVSDNTIALGYAVAYPLGVIGIILSIIFVPDISIQCSDHTVILEKWNKFSWRNKTTGRTDPAGESFHTDDCTSDTVAFGLQIESKFFVFQTDFYVVEHLLFFFQLINDLICEITDPFIKISLDLGSSELCIVTHGRCIRMLL